MIKFKTDWQPKKLLQQSSEQSLLPRLSGERLVLSPPQWEDYEGWTTVRGLNRDYLQEYEPLWPNDALSKVFFKRRLERQENEMAAGRGCYFLIRKKDTGKIIGGINLNNIQYGVTMAASLGYWLDEKLQGQGYMSEAGQLVIRYVFENLKLHRINAACLPQNERSAKILLKWGFEEEGYAKKYLQINGQWQDHRLFGLSNSNH